MAATGTTPSTQARVMARWLLAVAALVVLIVVVGGITRLTESGLSITEWKPISGTLPPLTQEAWDQEFAHYRQIDQYAAVHAGMTLSEFKGIFFWEYIHRVLGRIIGMAVALPLAWFWVRGRIPAGYKPRLFALLALIGLQGTLGWLMVHSGLQKGMTEVAPLWLATHLITALFTLSGLVWTALDLLALSRNPAAKPASLTPFAALAGLGLAVQLVWGALMAGLRAGRVTNEWPLMNGSFWPGASQNGESFLHAITADPAIVHFIHRWWAWGVVALLVVLARKVKAAGDRRAAIAIHSAFGTQVLLGIATVMTDVSIGIAVLHQLVGALLVAATAWGAHAVGRRA
ncbi:COX15/CtaA family protein [Novosphingobium terrae]|uniref:COX15/CtaA family protein n=1 Tax=Novosphingobium terrae TaxID=2726189 RepID=UPI001981EF8E|nr:COX15/CtaA family protein [Novosphingobium terrae]